MTSSKPLELIFILGTRPEAIKLGPIILEAKKRGINYTIVVTGQHPKMCEDVLSDYDLYPQHRLKLQNFGVNLTQLTGNLLLEISQIQIELDNQFVIVQGDTTSALVGAYYGFLNRLKVAHIEAGLRTNQLDSPFPEEMNRRLISRLASIHFAATENNRRTLVQEKIPGEIIHTVGNTVIDALKYFRTESDTPKDGFRVLVTLHRRENHGNNIRTSTKVLAKIARKYVNSIGFTIIRHPNPNAWNSVDCDFLSLPNVETIPPQDYKNLLHLLSGISVLITDSGGLQEEATYIGLPTLIVREETERDEAIESGVCTLVGIEGTKLESTLIEFIENDSILKSHATGSNVFGDGNASKLILNELQKAHEKAELSHEN